MPKLRLKISGLFRSDEGAMAILIIRSHVSTLQQNDLSIIEGLVQAVEGDPWMPNDPHNCQFEN